jgi:hypothetical protein
MGSYDCTSTVSSPSITVPSIATVISRRRPATTIWSSPSRATESPSISESSVGPKVNVDHCSPHGTWQALLHVSSSTALASSHSSASST